MRDIYNRNKRLSDWIERVDRELDQSDRTDVLRFVEYMTDNENAILWITRCITALISMRKFMRNSFRDSNKDDIRVLIDFIEHRYTFKQKKLQTRNDREIQDNSKVILQSRLRQQ